MRWLTPISWSTRRTDVLDDTASRMLLAVSPATSVRRVLELIGVGRLMPMYSSLSEAMDAA